MAEAGSWGLGNRLSALVSCLALALATNRTLLVRGWFAFPSTMGELFAAPAVAGVGPAWREVEAEWRARWASLLAEATLTPPRDSAMQPQGHLGIHSEHMGHLLGTMQHLQRAYPGGVW